MHGALSRWGLRLDQRLSQATRDDAAALFGSRCCLHVVSDISQQASTHVHYVAALRSTHSTAIACRACNKVVSRLLLLPAAARHAQ